MNKAETVRITPAGVVFENVFEDAAAAGVQVRRDPGSFELKAIAPSTRSIYYRIHFDRLEWGPEIAAMVPSGDRGTPDPGTLIAMVHGIAPPPDTTIVPEVHRLVLGTSIQVTTAGIAVTRSAPLLAPPVTSLHDAVAAYLQTLRDDFAIAYSGGLGSAFVAVAAASVGGHGPLLHAELGPAVDRAAPPPIPGLRIHRVRVDVADLLDHQGITGEEPLPPLPDLDAPRRLTERLAEHSGRRIVGGALLEDLVSTKLPLVDAGAWGWRLLGCEPFHIAGILPDLRAARALWSSGVVYSPPGRGGPDHADVQPVTAPPPPSPTGASDLPGLTEYGRGLLESTHRGSMAVWKEHLGLLDPTLQRAVGGLQERGDAGLLLPALDPAVLSAVSAMAPAELGRIRRSAFVNHLPLHRAVTARGVTGTRRAAPAYWLRVAAAEHLLRERDKVTLSLQRGSVLADLGLIEPAAVVRVLADGQQLAQQALPMLRLVWLDHWLSERR